MNSKLPRPLTFVLMRHRSISYLWLALWMVAVSSAATAGDIRSGRAESTPGTGGASGVPQAYKFAMFFMVLL